MKMFRSLLLSLPILGAALMADRPAQACGGCVVPPDENTQVTGHRMIFATSMSQTTLYDQIEYSGDPAEFAWFLPIHGQVDVGLSSDAMFAFLGAASSPQVLPPPLNCPGPPDGCYYGEEDGAGAGTGGGGGNNAGGGVTVITQEVVGPFETVQLEATDPAALTDWLTSHGYAIPDDVLPVIQAYQQEGFGFLAMRLVPGQGVNAMRPVRVTSQGAGLQLPLRMVAASTGALTPITLYVMAEGRYQAQNFPNLLFQSTVVAYNWDDGSSNYDVLEQAMFENSNGFGWMTQHAEPYDKANFEWLVEQTISINPDTTGWGDPANGVTELADAQADLATLFAGMDDGSIWLTRMHAELTRPALGNDLTIEAEPGQTTVSRYIQAQYSLGTIPQCPDYSWCDGSIDNGGGDFNGFGQGNDKYFKGKGSCAIERPGKESGTAVLFAGIGLAAAAVVMRRRRNKK